MTIKKKTNLSIAVFAVFGLTFLFLAVFPFFREIRNNSQKLVLQRERAANNDAQNENLAQFKAFSVIFAANFKKIENLFIDPEVPVEFIRFLEDAAKSDHLQISIASLSRGVSEKDKWPSLSFQIVISGFFPDFLKFLEKIENSFYLIQIQNLNISAIGVNLSDSGDIEANFSIKVFTKSNNNANQKK